MNQNQLAADIRKASRDPDRYVLRIVYVNDGKRQRRVISPAGMKHPRLVRALCFAREEWRHFRVEQIESCELLDASAVIMPTPIVELPVEVEG